MRTLAIAAAFLFIQLAATGQGAQASEATPSGVSVGAGLDAFYDATVTDASGGAGLGGRRGEFGADVLVNVGDFAAGGVVAGNPDVLGDGRLLVGGRVGWQPTFGTTRVQLLGEMGIHRYTHVAEGFFSVSTPNFFSTPYLGVQLGITREFVKGGLFEYGVALLVRQDLDQQAVVHQEGGFLGSETPPPTDLTVGGTMVGVSLTLGFRVDSAIIEAMKHPHPEDQRAKRDASSSIE
jgi:hypothetical protein